MDAETEKTVEAEETKPAEEVEKPEGEETPPEEPKGDDADGEEKPEDEAKAVGAVEEKHKRAGGWQRKIERLERENAALVAKLTAPPAGQPPAVANAGATAEEKAAEYIDNLVMQRLAKREAEQQQRDAQAQFNQRMADARAAKPDFDEVILSADAPVSPALQQVILTSEHGPDIMYQLASNPAELARLSALPPLDAARAIGRLEAKLSSSTPAQKTKPSVRPPAPPTNVNGSAASTRRLEDLPISEYKRAFRSGQR